MARAKSKVKINRGRATNPAPLVSGAKALRIGIDAAKYTGYEPIWEDVDVTEDNRQHHLISGFNWYNYSFGSKDAQSFLVEYLVINKRKNEAKQFKRASDTSFTNAYGWMARMTMMGWELNEVETKQIEDAIKTSIASVPVKVVAANADDDETVNRAKFNIQERMREKLAEAAGELENMLDEFIADGAKARHKFQPIVLLKTANVLPAHVGNEIKHWEDIKAEFKAAHLGKDKDLKEGYDQFTKLQLRNLIKFAELVITDYHGYVAFKKSTKKARKRKIKTPVELARKLKFMAAHKEFDLTSLKPAKIVGAKEMFAFDVKKRKLMYFIADEYAGVLSVKNNTIDGFDKSKSVQKTIRKPKSQIAALLAASKPNTRKAFEKTKSVETKMSGRFNENIIILKVW